MLNVTVERIYELLGGEGLIVSFESSQNQTQHGGEKEGDHVENISISGKPTQWKHIKTVFCPELYVRRRNYR